MKLNIPGITVGGLSALVQLRYAVLPKRSAARALSLQHIQGPYSPLQAIRKLTQHDADKMSSASTSGMIREKKTRNFSSFCRFRITTPA